MRAHPLAAAVAAALLCLAVAGPVGAVSPRAGQLHVIKECSEYTGQAGSFCTFTVSNIKEIDPGDRIVYASAIGATSLDTDVMIAGGSDGIALGHCTLDFLSLPGVCTFDGGTGIFAHFHATVSVAPVSSTEWSWDGNYAFDPRQ